MEERRANKEESKQTKVKRVQMKTIEGTVLEMLGVVASL